MAKSIVVFVLVCAMGALLWSRPQTAGTGEISGIVIDAISGAGVPQASISIYGWAVTDRRSHRGG